MVKVAAGMFVPLSVSASARGEVKSQCLAVGDWASLRLPSRRVL